MMVTAKLPPGSEGARTGSHSVFGLVLPSFVREAAGETLGPGGPAYRDRGQRPWRPGRNKVRQVRRVS